MYFLYECGQCGALNQVDVSSWLQNKDRYACHECGHANSFGPVAPSTKDKPVIEQMVRDKNQQDNIVAPQSVDKHDIEWECGICNHAYQFSTQNISLQGSKLTCSTCFNFILLQPMIFNQDVPMMQGASGAQTEKISTQQEDSSHSVLHDKTTTVLTQEIIEVFEENQSQSFLEDANTVIRTGYADPRKPKSTPQKAQEESPITSVSLQDPDINIPPAQQNSVMDISNEKIDSLFTKPYDKISQPATTPKKKTKEEHDTPPHPTPTSKRKSKEIEPILSKEVQDISHAYLNENSFIAYKSFKEDDTFTYNFNEKDIKEIDPEEHVPESIKKVEKNMIRYSLIASGILILLFVAFFFYREHRRAKLKEEIQKKTEQLIEEQERDRQNKPQYGFPEVAPESEGDASQSE